MRVPAIPPAEMLELVPAQAQGEYVLDRYHCKHKIQNALGSPNRLLNQAYQALRNYDYGQLIWILDTLESMGLSASSRTASITCELILVRTTVALAALAT